MLDIRNHRSHFGGGVHADTKLDLGGIGGDARHHFVEDLLLHEQPRAGIAALAVIEENRSRGARDRRFDIGVIQR